MTENQSEQERKGRTRLAVVITGFSLAAGIGLALSPRSIQVWSMAILALPLNIAAAVSFAASAMLAWRRRTLFLTVMWAVLSCFFLLMLLADGEYLHQLILAAREGGNR